IALLASIIWLGKKCFLKGQLPIGRNPQRMIGVHQEILCFNCLLFNFRQITLRSHQFLLAASATACATAYAGQLKPEGAPQTVVVNGSSTDYDARRDDTAGKVVVNREEIVR